ncbi:MAG TPA: DMT family transporter [Acidimicrobiia bacterium]|nr:DMT family transporter [Acidimicrobiia bacterium]
MAGAARRIRGTARALNDQSAPAGAPPAVAVALVAGAFGAIQPKINAELGTRVGSTLLASLVNFAAALVVVAIALSLRPGTRRLLRQLRSWQVPRWTLTAGLGGALIVIAGALAVETIGVAIFSVAFFAGQITFGVLVDRIGIAPGGRRPVSTARLQAALVAVVAVVVSQIGRPVGEFEPALVALVVVAGAAVAFQSAFNGRITMATGDPIAATAVNVVVGLVALAAIVAAVTVTGHVDTPRWPAEPWLYAGGILGVSIVLSLAIATAVLGVLRATLVMLAAQLVTAFVVDWAVDHDAPTPGVIAGAALIVTAAALVRRRPATRVSGRQ